MKTRILLAGILAATMSTSLTTRAADTTKFSARSGSKMRMEGTSNIHDWQVESPLILGYLEVGSNFPVEPGQSVSPGKVEAKGEASVTVRSLKSIEKDGKPYSDRMDEVMGEKLKMEQFPKIIYRLTELTLKEPAKSKDAPYVFDSKGDLEIAGVTNSVSMPINVLPMPDKKLKISGTVTVKMTDFKIEPPAPKIALGAIKTGDEVKLIFDWMVGPQKSASTAAAK
jgi:polyisoprenoid-binding protein YceI